MLTPSGGSQIADDIAVLMDNLEHCIASSEPLPEVKVILLTLAGILKAGEIHSVIELKDHCARIAGRFIARREAERNGVPQ
jgi:hypothetical protein